MMARTLGAGHRSRGELLSFLLFDEQFIGALIEMGKRDARRRARIKEQHAIEKFRTHRMLRAGS